MRSSEPLGHAATVAASGWGIGETGLFLVVGLGSSTNLLWVDKSADERSQVLCRVNQGDRECMQTVKNELISALLRIYGTSTK